MTLCTDTRRFRAALALLTVLPLSPVLAQESTESNRAKSASSLTQAASSLELNEVVVTGQFEFLSADTSGATNLPLPIEKVPQSISLVSQDFIKAADIKTLGEIAEYTPGALNVGNQEGFNTIIKLRGFNSDVAIDGMNLGSGAGTYEPDWAIVDRLEIVKGPSSVIYGVANAGGLVNLVTKSATATTPSYLSVEGGSWDSWRVEGQLAGAITPQVHALGVVVQDQGDSFMDGVKHTSTVLYGAFNANLGDSVTGYLHGGWERHVRTSFDGIPTEADGSPAPLARSFFIGSPDMKIYTAVYHGEGGITWHATDMLDLSVKTTVREATYHGAQSYSYDLQQNGDIDLGGTYQPERKSTNYGVDGSAMYRLDSLGLRDSFVSVMALYQDSHSTLVSGDYLFDGEDGTTSNIFDGEAAIFKLFNSATPTGPTYTSITDLKILTLSGQSIITPIDHLSVLLGSSYSKPTQDQDNSGKSTDFEFPGQTSYRGAISYEALPGMNTYLSFSQSFEPQETYGVDGNLLPPLQGDQYEAGVKYRSTGGHLLLTGAAYQLTQKNAAEFYGHIDGMDRYQAIGEVRHRGVELQAVGRITQQWQINGGYAYLDPKITKDTDLAIVGQTDTFLPRQTADVFTDYTFDAAPVRGLSAGLGVRYVGSERTSLDGSTKDIASYTLLDITAGYAIDKWSLRLNVHNILDKRYYINNYQTLFYGNVVGTPTNVDFTIRRNF